MDEPEGSYAPESPDLSACQPAHVPEPYSYSYASRSDPHRMSLEDAPDETATPYRRDADKPPLDHAMSGPPVDSMEDDDDDEDYEDRPRARRSRNARKTSKAVSTEPLEGDVEIKTKFPVARIKRIMQADEDVGKVSQVTPVAVCKSR